MDFFGERDLVYLYGTRNDDLTETLAARSACSKFETDLEPNHGVKRLKSFQLNKAEEGRSRLELFRTVFVSGPVPRGGSYLGPFYLND